MIEDVIVMSGSSMHEIFQNDVRHSSDSSGNEPGSRSYAGEFYIHGAFLFVLYSCDISSFKCFHCVPSLSAGLVV